MSEPKTTAWTVEATVRGTNMFADDAEMAERQTRQHLTSFGYTVLEVRSEPKP